MKQAVKITTEEGQLIVNFKLLESVLDEIITITQRAPDSDYCDVMFRDGSYLAVECLFEQAEDSLLTLQRIRQDNVPFFVADIFTEALVRKAFEEEDQ